MGADFSYLRVGFEHGLVYLNLRWFSFSWSVFLVILFFSSSLFFFFTVFPHLICPLFLFLLSPLRVFVPFFTCFFFLLCFLLIHFVLSPSSVSSLTFIFPCCFLLFPPRPFPLPHLSYLLPFTLVLSSMFSYPFHSFSPLPSSFHSLSLPLYSYSLSRILIYLIHFVYWSLLIFPTSLSLHSLSLPFIHPLCFLLRFHQPCL